MAAIATRQQAHHLSADSSTRANLPMDSKKSIVKTEDKQIKASPSTSNADIKKPSQSSTSSATATKSESNGVDTKPTINADGAAPLAPPPKPSQSGNEGGDYFSSNHQGNNPSYNSEPNLFENAFTKLPETPGGTQLPPVASLTSPAGQLSGSASGGFNWGGSLRSGPLSPAMLSGPAGEDYFSTSSIRGGFPTPNESSLRTGLTPGGGGSMFPPAPSPNTQALFNQLGAGFATPGTLDFHRTAMNANKKADPYTSAAPAAQTTTAAADSSARASANQQNFDQHDAANGLFMLAQAGTESQQGGAYAQNQQDAKRPSRVNNGSVSNMSDITAGRDTAPSEEADQKPNTRNKNKKAAGGKNARKADETPSKQPAKKKGKANNGAAQNMNQFDDEPDSEEEMKEEDQEDLIGKDGKKMTDEEKRKNFLERNRVAALKCRQRKKQWLANLQAKVEIFSSENDALSAQVTQLREEILNLKTILIAHKDCPIAQQQAAVGQYIPSHGPDYGAHGNPYGNFQQPGQVPMGAGGPRRYS